MLVEEQVQIPHEGAVVHGDLAVPEDATGVVVFAHGSGSSRFSRRNRQVGEVLQRRGLATLLMDLPTHEEEMVEIPTGHLRFDIGLLAERLIAAVDWLGTRPDTAPLPVGLFGASTGAAAALVAAEGRPERIAAVVSRGGRPDLAGGAVALVAAPALLIVGGNDDLVLGLNREAYERLRSERQLEVIPGATHLFEEQGALEEVARLAAAWFATHLVPQAEASAAMRRERR